MPIAVRSRGGRKWQMTAAKAACASVTMIAGLRLELSPLADQSLWTFSASRTAAACVAFNFLMRSE